MRALHTVSAFVTASAMAYAGVIPLISYNQMEIPVTPFSNMASGYQATNPGFRAVLRSEDGDFIAGGEMNMDAVIRGRSDDASSGSAYGKLILSVDVQEAFPSVSAGIMSGTYRGKLSICMAKDDKSSLQSTECKNLSGNIHPNRPFQWIDKPVEFLVSNGNIRITKFFGSTGEGGTSQQIALAVYHPAFGFAAPGKAFKDYQSPLVLDLDGNGQLDLVDVWADSPVVRFDLSGGGQPFRTGWVKATDGFLFDGRKNACVVDGTQLFGEFTGSANGKPSYENGFKALEALFGKAGANRIDVRDGDGLRIWRDKNQDGVCTADETEPAAKVVRSISLVYKTVSHPPLVEDNEIRLVGSYVTRDGKERQIGDVWFKQRRNDMAVR